MMAVFTLCFTLDSITNYLRNAYPSGLETEARELHKGFLGAWKEFGWLPEMFGLDLAHVDTQDGGYVHSHFDICSQLHVFDYGHTVRKNSDVNTQWI